MKRSGVVAAGHRTTADVAAQVLAAGGNAFDAALAGMCAACVAEPALCSMGGGGHLLARTAEGRSILYDFFAQTPRAFRAAGETDFFAAEADFGSERQEFHIGLGSMAVPGIVKGMFEVHRDLGTVPMADIVAPAAGLARDGIAVDARQASIFAIVRAIYLATPAARALFASARDGNVTLGEGEMLRMPEFAATLEALARQGSDLFYRGDIAQRIAADCRDHGGHLSLEDLACYRVLRRDPLSFIYRGRRIATNPPPSTGGPLIAFALALLSPLEAACRGPRFDDALLLLAEVMERTNRARAAARGGDRPLSGALAGLLDPAQVARFAQGLEDGPPCRRGTTHLSVVDGTGNAAALSLSNGEGAAYLVPGTGIMMNNMLGEEDINPEGFHAWPTDRRMASMMAPTLALDNDGGIIALGSGGSNRLRTAILQVLVRLLDYAASVEAAVHGPRIHVENGVVHVEPGFAEGALDPLADGTWTLKRWPERSMYFGGVHVAYARPDRRIVRGAGDPRRDGACVVV
jgi:gamma-glutamyltranspeptidase/glutathione hydrolase